MRQFLFYYTLNNKQILAGSSNGRTAAFEAVNLGPIPSPAAKNMLAYASIIFYILPTKSIPGVSVSSPGFQLAGQTFPLCSRTNFAA